MYNLPQQIDRDLPPFLNTPKQRQGIDWSKSDGKYTYSFYNSQ